MALTTLTPTTIDALTMAVEDLDRVLEHTDELDRATSDAVHDALHQLMRFTRQPVHDDRQGQLWAP